MQLHRAVLPRSTGVQTHSVSTNAASSSRAQIVPDSAATIDALTFLIIWGCPLLLLSLINISASDIIYCYSRYHFAKEGTHNAKNAFSASNSKTIFEQTFCTLPSVFVYRQFKFH